MYVHGTLSPISKSRGIDWSRESLDQGSPLSIQVLKTLESADVQAYAILPQGEAGMSLDDFKSSARIGDANLVLKTILSELSSRLVGVLIVDDDLARRGDPGLDDASFVGDRVVRWADLHSPPEGLTRLIRRGASGYPLNAFVCESEYGHSVKIASGTLSEQRVASLANGVRLVIHSIFDAESFLILVFDDRLKDFLDSFTETVA